MNVSRPPASLNTQRLEPVFSAETFKRAGHRITLIGAGSIGSKVGKELARSGLSFDVYDHDDVSEVNVSNQDYGLPDINKLKTRALFESVRRDTGIEIVTHSERYSGQELEGIVFVCTDDMHSRRVVFSNCRMKLAVPLLIEGRMGAREGRVYAFNPHCPGHIRGYEAPDVSYSDAERSDLGAPACRTAVSVGSTAAIVANLMLWQLYRWWGVECGGKDILDNEIILFLQPLLIQTRRFEV